MGYAPLKEENSSHHGAAGQLGRGVFKQEIAALWRNAI
jgi:hypothetical protein